MTSTTSGSNADHSQTISLVIRNMHCPSCVDRIDSLLSSIQEVKDVRVTLTFRTVSCRINSSESSSGRAGRKVIHDKVVDILTRDDGFIIGDEGHSNPTGRVQASHGPKGAWARLQQTFHSGPTREQRSELERRRQHLAHCIACQKGATFAGDVSLASATHSSRESLNSLPTTEGTLTALSIGGMTCASCVQSIKTNLQSDSRIVQVDVDLLSSSASVRHSPNLSPEEIAERISDIGYDAHVVSSHSPIANMPPSSTAPDSSRRATNADDLLETSLSIEGMTCASCSQTITNVLKPLQGIRSVNVDLVGNSAKVIHDSRISEGDIKEAIEHAGYGVEAAATMRLVSPVRGVEVEDDRRTVQIGVKGIYCEDCIDKLNTAVADLPLISSTTFNMDCSNVTMAYRPTVINIRQILEALESLAPEFEAQVLRNDTLSERGRKVQKKEVRYLAIHFLIALLFAIPAFVVAVIGLALLPSSNAFRQTWMRSVWGAANIGTITLWPLATCVQFGVGRIFYKRALAPLKPHIRGILRSARHSKQSTTRTAPWTWRPFFHFGSMDLLVVLSTSVSYFASVAMLIIDVRSPSSSPSIGTYFDSCIFLITFILLGRVLESYARERTTDAVAELGSMRPENAILLEEETSSNRAPMDHNALDEGKPALPDQRGLPMRTRRIPIEQLEKGDLVLIPPGSVPPIDGVIVSGSTTFDESSLTGESKPVPKSTRSEVFTGTVNMKSAVTLRVTTLPSHTMLDQIISAVSNASTHKAPIEKLAERLTGVFVPIIVYLSMVVAAVWLCVAFTTDVGANHLATGGGRAFFAIEFAISTLVVACPCGIGLAVPCANAVGIGLAAKHGILACKGGEAFLAARQIQKVALDKTGTLTTGKTSVVAARYWPNDLPGGSHHQISKDNLTTDEGAAFDQQLIEAAVLELAKGSSHPLARGMTEWLASQGHTIPGLKIIQTREVPGRGLRGSIEFTSNDPRQTVAFSLLFGNLALLEENGAVVSESQTDVLDKFINDARSIVLVAIKTVCRTPGGEVDESNRQHDADLSTPFKLVAAYALSDPPRDTTACVIQSLQAQMKRIIMLTGDNIETARAVARTVGIDPKDIMAGIKPIDKADVIRQLQGMPPLQEKTLQSSSHSKGPNPCKKGAERTVSEKVMFVGDGINDTVALAAADVAVAMGHGSQAVLSSADFVLLNSSLDSLPILFSLSKKVYNRQRMNLGWAIIFNVVCLPFAAGVFYHAGGLRLTPVWSAVLMAASSVSVVLSSLAMRWI